MPRPSATPRGIRNNNPGNIDYHPQAGWQNLDTPPSDGRFCRFKTPVDGIRALCRVLITYQDKRLAPDGSRIDTVREFIHRWAPPNENDTKAYIDAVRGQLGLDGSEFSGEVDVHRFDHMKPLVKAIIRHENGRQPYTDAQIDAAMLMVGVRPPPQPLQQSAEIKQAELAIGGAAGAGVTGIAAIGELTDQVRDVADQISPLAYYSRWIMIAFLALTLASVGLGIWAKMRARKQGVS